MKNLSIKTLAILLAIMSITCTTQADYNPFNTNAHIFKKKKTTQKTIQFNPDNAFGGSQAQGKYLKKARTATITNGDITYTFDTTSESPNPSLIPNPQNLVALGFFSNKETRANMPIITHVFGLPSNDAAQQAVLTSQIEETNIQIAQDEQAFDEELTQFDDQSMQEQPQPQVPSFKKLMGANRATHAPIRFKPADKFAGPGLVGNYSSATQVATIHDPSQKNPTHYVFENVRETAPITDDSSLVLIGSYTQSPKPGNNGIRSHLVRLVRLYGKLKNEQ